MSPRRAARASCGNWSKTRGRYAASPVERWRSATSTPTRAPTSATLPGRRSQGFNPIVFCRFIPTAEYLAEELRDALPKKVAVEAVTGLLPPADREARVEALAGHEQRVLVCTDCLSEGVNLQDHFDAVVHYDLAWNPTRHEQREGRVDRYGQKRKQVRVVTYYGLDNGIDGVVLDVLLRKHRAIRGSLGISVPVPVDNDKFMSAILHGTLMRGHGTQLALDLVQPERDELHTKWQAAAVREKVSRTLFAQHGIRPEAVGEELAAVRQAVGSGADCERFLAEALAGYGAIVSGTAAVGRLAPGVDPVARAAGGSAPRPVVIKLKDVPVAVRDAIEAGEREDLQVRFALPIGDGEIHLHRTHPIVEGLAGHVLDTAIDPLLAPKALARRAGVIRTRDVETRTTLLLLRMRFHIHTAQGKEERALLAEDCHLAAWRGAASAEGEPAWLSREEAEALLRATPAANVAPDAARHFAERALDDLPNLRPALERLAHEQAESIRAAHERVRQAVKGRGTRTRVEPKLPADILGLYVYLPAGS